MMKQTDTKQSCKTDVSGHSPRRSRWLLHAVSLAMFACIGLSAWCFSSSLQSTPDAVASPTSPAIQYVTKNIEDIQQGDLVLSRNEHTGEVGYKRVENAFRRTSKHLRILSIKHPQTGAVDTIKTTAEHPFWVSNTGWVNAGDLTNGQFLERADGEIAIVTATHREEHPDGVPVYNFTVPDWHTYFVAQDEDSSHPIYVHNADCIEFADDLAKQHPCGTKFQMDLSRRQLSTGDLPGYPVRGQPTGPFHKHKFLLEDGKLFDPAFPDGIPVEDWLKQFADNNNLPLENVLDFFHFTPDL